MARFVWNDQFFDANGNPLSGGKAYFYLTGTTTDKTTYSDSDMTVANSQPVVLDADGRLPDVFFSGVAKLVLTDSADVTIETKDPVGDDRVDDNWADWDSATTYSLGQIVVGSDNAYYKSIQNSNTNNDPTASPTYWTLVRLLPDWNTNETYIIDDVVIGPDAILYISLQNSNSGNTPASSAAYWKPVLTATDTQTLTNKVITEIDYDMTTETELDPANGFFQYRTMTANTTFTDTMINGSGILLTLSGGATYSATWPGTWEWAGGSAPTTTAKDLIAIVKTDDVVQATYIGALS